MRVFRVQLKKEGLPPAVVVKLAAEYKGLLRLGELAAFSKKSADQPSSACNMTSGRPQPADSSYGPIPK